MILLFFRNEFFFGQEFPVLIKFWTSFWTTFLVTFWTTFWIEGQMAKQRGQIQVRKHRAFWSFLWSHLGQKVRGPRKCWDRQRARNAKGLGTPKSTKGLWTPKGWDWERQRARNAKGLPPRASAPKGPGQISESENLVDFWRSKAGTLLPTAKQNLKKGREKLKRLRAAGKLRGRGKIRSPNQKKAYEGLAKTIIHFFHQNILNLRRWWEILVSKVDPLQYFPKGTHHGHSFCAIFIEQTELNCTTFLRAVKIWDMKDLLKIFKYWEYLTF